MINAIVVGCGRVGSQLAVMLSESGNNVCCIDSSADAFANLGQNFNGSTIQGVGFDEETLLRAGIEECDIVAAVTAFDSTNLMIAEVANRLFNVPHVIARLYNPGHERAYLQLGIDYVCGTTLVSETIFSKVMSGHGSHVTTFSQYELLKFSLYLGVRDDGSSRFIHASKLEREGDVSIVAYERAGTTKAALASAEDFLLYNGDVILACVRQDCIEEFLGYLDSLGTDVPTADAGQARGTDASALRGKTAGQFNELPGEVPRQALHQRI